MGRKKANFDIEEKIEPMKPDAMNPPENFEDSENHAPFGFGLPPNHLPSKTPTA